MSNNAEVATGHSVLSHFVANIVVLLKDKGILTKDEASSFLLEAVGELIDKLPDTYDDETKTRLATFFRAAAAALAGGQV